VLFGVLPTLWRHAQKPRHAGLSKTAAPAIAPFPTMLVTTHSAQAAASAAPRQRTFPPRRIGDWKIDMLLAEGAFSRVYRARPAGFSTNQPADYAVKVLRERCQNEPLAMEMLRREAALGANLSHPHLVPVLDASVSSPPYYLVMPRLEGISLRTALADGEPLIVPHALWIARQVAEAMGAMHAWRWLHGDIKPANIFVAPSGHVTLLDLGMARRMDRPGHMIDRPVTGTFHYIAPELVTSVMAADQRSDIYSLGVTLYRSLTGRLPFTAESIDELVRAHRELAVPDLRRFRPQLPRTVCQLIREMLAKQPIRRPQNAGELVARLMELEIETFAER
jgi:serine/threonine-protein kinase